MNPEVFASQIQDIHTWFNRSTSALTEEDSSFAPVEGTHTVAQQVAHVAWTVEWFLEGAFRPEGFDLDFDKEKAALEKVTSLTEARVWLERAFHQAAEVIGSQTMESLTERLPEGPVMGGAPRLAIVSALQDHTAHHRGALTVYARLLGKVPPMPYM
jgi:uncharacterized damage-inducible protein DinB